MTDSRVRSTNIYTPKQTKKVQWKVKHYTGANSHDCPEMHFFFSANLICIEKSLSVEIKDNESARLERWREWERMEKKSVGVQVLLNVPADGQTGRFHIETWIPSSILLTPTHTLTCVSHSKRRCANQWPNTQCDWQPALSHSSSLALSVVIEMNLQNSICMSFSVCVCVCVCFLSSMSVFQFLIEMRSGFILLFQNEKKMSQLRLIEAN